MVRRVSSTRTTFLLEAGEYFVRTSWGARSKSRPGQSLVGTN